MTVQSIDWLAVAAPTILAVAAVVVLMADAFLGRGGRDGLDGRRLDDGRRLLPSVLTIAAVVVAAVPTVLLWDEPARSTFCIEEPLQGPQLCSFATDRFTLVFWGIVLFGTAVVALIGTAATRDGRIPQGEWHFLLFQGDRKLAEQRFEVR